MIVVRVGRSVGKLAFYILLLEFGFNWFFRGNLEKLLKVLKVCLFFKFLYFYNFISVILKGFVGISC